jgi:hypothetical protein
MSLRSNSVLLGRSLGLWEIKQDMSLPWAAFSPFG